MSTKNATDTANSATSDLADPAKDVVGGRKPGGAVSGLGNKVGGATGTSGSPTEGGEKKESSLRIHIELDLDVEVHLTARVKGDITIGLL